MQKTLGMKFDSEKPRMGLLPPRALESVADVLTFGAKKYQPDNWKYVENGKQRYIDASLRHITSFMKGQKNDPETNIHHLSHAICCLMFIVDLDLEQLEKDKFGVYGIPTESTYVKGVTVGPTITSKNSIDNLNTYMFNMVKDAQ